MGWPLHVPIVLKAPEQFGLRQAWSRTSLLQFIRRLRQLILVAHRPVLIDFSDTIKMYADGTILFAAELDRIRYAVSRSGKKLRLKCNYPSNDTVEQVLQHLKLLKLMQRKGRLQITADDVRHWHFTTSTNVDGSTTNDLIEDYEHLFPEIDMQKVYVGLTEAMTNCKHHAYTQERNDNTKEPHEERWWVFSEVKDGMLSVLICDLGIGIRRSLLEGKKWPVALLKRVLSAMGIKKQYDCAYIKIAMRLGESKTHQSHRGKGLPEIKSVIESTGKGCMYILSNNGMCSYFPSNNPAEKMQEFRDSILGTLIMWQIPVGHSEKES